MVCAFWGAFGMKLMCPSCDTSRAIAAFMGGLKGGGGDGPV